MKNGASLKNHIEAAIVRLVKSFVGRFKALAAMSGCLILLGSPAVADSGNLLMISIAPAARQGNAKSVHAKVLIEAPPALVWEMLTDYAQMSDILPGYEASRVVRTGGSGALVDVAMKVAAFLPTYRYQVRAQEREPDYRLSLTRVSGDFRSLAAVYNLYPRDGGKSTLLTYQLNIDPGFTLPGAQGLIRANTEKSMKALEAYAERAYHKSEIGQR